MFLSDAKEDIETAQIRYICDSQNIFVIHKINLRFAKNFANTNDKLRFA